MTGAALRGTTLNAIAGHAGPGRATRTRYQWQRDTGSGFVDIAGARHARPTSSPSRTWARACACASPRPTRTRPSAPTSLGTAVVQAGPPAAVDGADDLRHAPVAPSGCPRRLGEWIGIENDYAYQWQRDTGSGYANIAGATDDRPTCSCRPTCGAKVRLKVTATNDDGTATRVQRRDRAPSPPPRRPTSRVPTHHRLAAQARDTLTALPRRVDARRPTYQYAVAARRRRHPQRQRHDLHAARPTTSASSCASRSPRSTSTVAAPRSPPPTARVAAAAGEHSSRRARRPGRRARRPRSPPCRARGTTRTRSSPTRGCAARRPTP